MELGEPSGRLETTTPELLDTALACSGAEQNSKWLQSFRRSIDRAHHSGEQSGAVWVPDHGSIADHDNMVRGANGSPATA